MVGQQSPVRMFKYLLLKTIYTVSDVDVVERSRFDMSSKYFLEMAPEDDVLNSSSLTEFRKLCLKDTIIGDEAYSEKENLKLTSEQYIKVLARLNPPITQGFRKDEHKFDYNKDADKFVYPAGHMAIRKALRGKKKIGTNIIKTNLLF